MANNRMNLIAEDEEGNLVAFFKLAWHNGGEWYPALLERTPEKFVKDLEDFFMKGSFETIYIETEQDGKVGPIYHGL